MRFLPKDDPRRLVWEACESPIEEMLCCGLFTYLGCKAVSGMFNMLRRAELADLAGDVPAAFVFSQHRIGRYRADFLVVLIDPVKRASQRIVLECDGARYHSSAEQCAYDMARDADIVAGGYEVIRLPGTNIHYDVREAMHRLKAKFEQFGVGIIEPDDCAGYALLAEQFTWGRKAREQRLAERQALIAAEDDEIRIAAAQAFAP